MNNGLAIFEGIELEILTKEDVKIEFNGECLFNGKQICGVLLHSNPSKAIADNVDEENKLLLKSSDIKTKFRKLNNRGEMFINEEGTLNLIFRSELISNERKNSLINNLNKYNIFKNIQLIKSERKEIKFLDELEKQLKWWEEDFIYSYNMVTSVKNDEYAKSICPTYNLNLLRQYSVCNGKYRIDCYIPKYRIAIEYDENNHNYQKEEDKIREQEISKFLFEENLLSCSEYNTKEFLNNMEKEGYDNLSEYLMEDIEQKEIDNYIEWIRIDEGGEERAIQFIKNRIVHNIM